MNVCAQIRALSLRYPLLVLQNCYLPHASRFVPLGWVWLWALPQKSHPDPMGMSMPPIQWEHGIHSAAVTLWVTVMYVKHQALIVIIKMVVSQSNETYFWSFPILRNLQMTVINLSIFINILSSVPQTVRKGLSSLLISVLGFGIHGFRA